MSQLNRLDIAVGKTNKAAAAFTSIFPDFRTIKATSPSEYVNLFWTKYLALPKENKDLNGKVFEYLLATLFAREGILPTYLSAKVAFVPNVTYDLMFYTAERGPICISAKTSLRERYKQADLEAIALKYVHRKALSYLITMEKKEAQSVKEKIRKGDVIGLDDVVVASQPEFDALIMRLKEFEFCEPPTVKVISSNQIITAEKMALL